MDDPEQRLAQWHERWAPPLVLYARQWLDRGEGEDVVQEAFVRLWEQRVAPQQVGAWLHATVRRAAIDRWRSRTRRTAREQATVPPVGWFEPDPATRSTRPTPRRR